MGLSGGEVASRAGLTEEQVKRFTELGIIRRREADGSYSEPDVLRARLALALEGSGTSPEDLRRVVDFELELFRTAIEQPLLQEGMSERQMLDQMAALRGQLEPYSSRLVHLLHRRHEEHALFQDVIEHVEQALADAGIAER